MAGAREAKPNPIREWIAEEMSASSRPISAKQIHHQHGHPISVLNFHLDRLVNEGRAVVVSREPRDGTEERFYLATKNTGQDLPGSG